MNVIYVIKNFATGKYLSVENEWDTPLMCTEFDTEQQAIQIAQIVIEESITIEKIYKL
jgi:hypothetical protein